MEKQNIEQDYKPIPHEELIEPKKDWLLIARAIFFFLVLAGAGIYLWLQNNKENDRIILDENINIVNIVDDQISGDASDEIVEPNIEEAISIDCLPEQRNADVCIEIYQPVCATVNVQCIKAPCPPIEQTFGNSCQACMNGLVSSYTMGECQVDKK